MSGTRGMHARAIPGKGFAMPAKEESRGTLLVLTEDRARGTRFKRSLGRIYRVTVLKDLSALLSSGPSEVPDLILIDRSGPPPTDLCRAIRRDHRTSEIPLLVLADADGDQVRLLESGADDCIPRSSSSDLLRLKVRALLGLKHSCDAFAVAEFAAREKVEELEYMVQMVAHDLKSPVVAIHGFVNLLRKRCRETLPDQRRDEMLDYLAAASRTLQDFLNDLSQVLQSEKVALDLEEVRLHDLATDVVHRHEGEIREKGITVEMDFAEGHPPVMVDKHRLEQVFDNLLVNAMTHMGDREDARIRIYIREDREFVTAGVSDNGLGIPRVHQESVFKRFFRVPGRSGKPGTGLGLAIAKSVVESHGGRIRLDSDEGRGATFSFTLPKHVRPEQRKGVSTTDQATEETSPDRARRARLTAE
jgi:signal transduction histidine kinase